MLFVTPDVWHDVRFRRVLVLAGSAAVVLKGVAFIVAAFAAGGVVDLVASTPRCLREQASGRA